MKRGSVIAPLILIGIGALFLMRNVWPEIAIGELLSRFWPFILMGVAFAGVLLVMLVVPFPTYERVEDWVKYQLELLELEKR